MEETFIVSLINFDRKKKQEREEKWAERFISYCVKESNLAWQGHGFIFPFCFEKRGFMSSFDFIDVFADFISLYVVVSYFIIF